MRLSFISLVLSVLSLLGARAQTSLPGVIHTGPQQSFHVQGVVVDVKHQCVYYSFTTSLLKTDLQGNVIGSVEGLTGHLGCLTMNPADGKIYGSLEYKDDGIGNIIRQRLNKNENLSFSSKFYIAIFDGSKITRRGMQAERDGIMNTVYLRQPADDYAAKVTVGGKEFDHRYGCSGIDGVAFAPHPGTTDKMRLYVAYGVYGDNLRTDNDYQVLLEYDTKQWDKLARPLSQERPHVSGPKKEVARYFVMTGNTSYGVQNLAYDCDRHCLFAAVYKGKKPQYPNYSLFAIDLSKKAGKAVLKGFDKPVSALTLPLMDGGMTHAASGTRGWNFKWGSTGLCYVGSDMFYISHNGKTADNRQYCDLTLYRYTGSNDGPFVKAY